LLTKLKYDFTCGFIVVLGGFFFAGDQKISVDMSAVLKPLDGKNGPLTA
jgi:hypothetical protein